jgi:ABC-type Fe3+ transport system substrate-binding protein
VAFVKFLLSKEGRGILERNGITPVKPTVAGQQQVPRVLKGTL